MVRGATKGWIKGFIIPSEMLSDTLTPVLCAIFFFTISFITIVFVLNKYINYILLSRLYKRLITSLFRNFLKNVDYVQIKKNILK